ncbi:transposase, partial [Microbulbifer thermotolerans]|uniref:transposase n=1 Tax=Microbulbifer thermotolerans TaxID=252514 RepID=UPI00224B134B
TTPANEHDLNVAHKLLHGDEQRVWADAGYGGAEKRKELKKRNLEWFIGIRPGSRKKLGCSHIKKAEKIKASVRAKVEHAFFYIKRMFGYSKIRYRGLAKNTNRLYVLSGLANLLRCQKYLLA